MAAVTVCSRASIKPGLLDFATYFTRRLSLHIGIAYNRIINLNQICNPCRFALLLEIIENLIKIIDRLKTPTSS